MAEKFKPLESIEKLDTIWSWIERFGVVKTMLIALSGAGALTIVVSRLQQFPRWIILALVFVTAAVALLLLLAFALWVQNKIKEAIKKAVSDNPLKERVTALENTLGPRHLDDDAQTKLLKALSGKPGKIRITAISPDDDAASYAQELADLLKKCGWDVWGPDCPYETRYRILGMTIGLVLMAPHDEPVVPYEGAQRLADALRDADIECRYYSSFELHKGSCELIVGHRGTPSYG